MPTWDFRCGECGHIRTKTFATTEERDREWVSCENCYSENPMEILPSAPNFSIQGFNAKNGYTKEPR